jgi:hypothetical protein
MVPFLRSVIPGQADLNSVIKAAILYETSQTTRKRKKCQQRGKVRFNWGPEQVTVFQKVKDAIASISLAGGDNSRQYHLATDASGTGIGGVLFQLRDTSAGTVPLENTRGKENFVMFMSFRLSDAETRYHTTEREALAVVRCLEEVHWLVLGATYPVKLYTDHQALTTILQGNDARGCIAQWQYQLSEYWLEYIHVPGQELAIADELSCIAHQVKRQSTTDLDDLLMLSMAVEPGNEATVKDLHNDQLQHWKSWLQEPRYGDIVCYKLTGWTSKAGVQA